MIEGAKKNVKWSLSKYDVTGITLLSTEEYEEAKKTHSRT